MRIYIKSSMITNDLLAYLGYGDVLKESGRTLTVSRMGIPHPGITWEKEERSQAAAALSHLKEKVGITDADFAQRLFLNKKTAEEVLAGEDALSDTELTIASGLFQVEKASLEKGIIKEIPDLEKELAECRRLLAALKEVLAGELEKAESFSGNKRYFVKPASEGGYLIFDAALMDFVKTLQGPVSFEDPVAALEGAYRMEHGYGNPAEEAVMPLELPDHFFAETIDGLMFIFDSRKQEEDGSDRLLAVADQAGGIVTMADVSEKDEKIIRSYAASRMQKAEIQKTGSAKKTPPMGMHLL